MNKFILFIFTLLGLLLFVRCSDYNKVLKSTDADYKYRKAVEYYDSSECYKSLPLLEELIGLTRGTQRAEDVYYYYAQSHYCVKDYYLANYYFKSFAKTFATSARAEECLFLAAMCSYKLSPSYSLDQMDTRNAVDEFQLFLDKYPGSSLADSATKMVETLNFKVERKNFEVASSYVKTLKYKAAVQSLKQFLKDYPASQFNEEAHYMIVKSHYEYALGSIESKRLERLRATNESYLTFALSYPDSKWLKEAEGYYKKSSAQIEKILAQTKKK
jgi:outer membrane protein assembly factor BamD